MPIHRPIKFKTTLEPRLIEQVREIMEENKTAKSVLNAALALIAVGGVMTLSVVAPGILGELNRTIVRRRKNKRREYDEIWRRFHYLKKNGAVEFIGREGEFLVYSITEKGKKRIKRLIFEELNIKIPKKWNKKWWIIIFDIPESKKRIREAFRKKVKEMGFYQCQKSVWVHPFPCIEEIEFLKEFFDIKPFVRVFVVEDMTDGEVLYHFSKLLKKHILD